MGKVLEKWSTPALYRPGSPLQKAWGKLLLSSMSFNNRMTSLVAVKNREYYSATMVCIRYQISVALVRSTVMRQLRGAAESGHPPFAADSATLVVAEAAIHC